MVYKGVDLQTGDFVAIKTSRFRRAQENVMGEIQVLKDLQGIQGITKVYWDGFSGDRYFAVMDLLGQNLQDIYKGRCTARDACIIAQQVIQILKKVHDRGYLHLDIKPQNLMVGSKNPSEIFLIDFGGGSKFRDENGEHVSMSTGYRHCCTPYYASNNLFHYRPTRRDDLITFSYVFLDLFSLLPWDGHEEEEILQQIKDDLYMGSLRDEFFRELPEQIFKYFVSCQKLEFSEDPDYDSLASLFQNLFEECGYTGAETLLGVFTDDIDDDHDNADDACEEEEWELSVSEDVEDNILDGDTENADNTDDDNGKDVKRVSDDQNIWRMKEKEEKEEEKEEGVKLEVSASEDNIDGDTEDDNNTDDDNKGELEWVSDDQKTWRLKKK